MNNPEPQADSSDEDAYVFPMSFAQQRLWFLAQLEPDSASYNMPVALRISGALNPTILEQSLQEVIRRHEALRTTFATIDGQPVQLIASEPPMLVSIVDFGSLPETEREAAVLRLAREEAQRPFDLTRGPLLRVHLIRLAAFEQVLLIIIHHIIFDGWSAAVLAREFAALYQAYAAGRPASLLPVPVQYADYAQWQRQWLQGAVLDAELAYWQDRLAGTDDVFRLPTDRPRPAVQSYRGARYRCALPVNTIEQLERMGREHGATLFMTLLAAFQVLLSRYSGQRDFCIGTPIANRPRLELEGLIGFFVNTLVLRARLDHDPTIIELLGRVRETVLGAQAHQNLPFEQLVEALHPARALSHSPLVQVLFALQQPAPVIELPGLTVKLFEVDPGAAQFDLSLEIVFEASAYQAIFEYSTDLFDESTIQRMAEHFLIVLDGMAARPDARVTDLSLLTDGERERLLMTSSALNSQHSALSIQACVHELIEEQAARTPDAIAVKFGDDRLTYRELDERTNQLAHELQRRGVGPDVLVGLCLERSIEMIVGLLGILKAGGAYVPVDPTHPKSRLVTIFNDAGLTLVLTQELLLPGLPHAGIEFLCLDRDWPAIARRPAGRVDSNVQPANLAYVLYTSGSTGVPKGVLITHRSLANYVLFATEMFDLQPSDRVLQFASVSFDASAEEIYPCLTSGGTLVLRTDAMLESVSTFLETCARWGITVLDLPTMYWHELTGRLGKEVHAIPSGLRLVIIGGEQARTDRLGQWGQCIGNGCRLINTYGPTETTIVATSVDITGATSDTVPVPIGGAIAEAQVYVLDAAMQPAPIGVPGELFIGGAGLARGYVNRPDLTAEKFVPDPFSGTLGARLYRTGDEVRRRADGQLEFLGRIDQQIKLRGFRIELGDIEAQLHAHPAIRDAAVMVREESGAPRLVGYIVGDPAPPARDLRQFLHDRLPDYMVPAAFVSLSALPHTSTGKVDRQSLPAPDPMAAKEQDRQAPRTRTEAALTEIWSGVLGVADIGVHDNFFELGGDSILSLQVVARAREAGIHLTPRHLFQHQTIADLASVAAQRAGTRNEQGRVDGNVPLTPIQHWFFEQALPNPHHWNQALLLEASRPIDGTVLEEAIQAVIEHHDALRMRFMREPEGWRQFYGPVEAGVLTRVDVSTIACEQRRSAVEAAAGEWQARLHLTDGPLLRAVWFDYGPLDSGRLLLVIHHLVVDAVSWWILLEDLQTAYAQRMQGEPIRLPAKTAAFQVWAQRLVAYAQSSSIQDEAAGWLALSHPARSLPVDDPTGACMESATAVRLETLSESETQALLRQAPNAYRMRIEEVLLTAFSHTLAEWTGDSRVLIELEGHGREDLFEDVDVSRTIGWFTSLYPVVLDVSPHASPAEALKAVKEQLRRVPRRGIGYGLLRYLTGGESARRLQAQPQPRVSFNYLGQWDQTFTADALFKPAGEGTGPERDRDALRSYELEVDAVIVDGHLQMRWGYSGARYRQETIEGLSRNCVNRLRELIAHCCAPEAHGLTPSDFPLAKLDQATLDLLAGAGHQIEDIYPLTPLQQGLLFHALYAPESGVYVEQISCTLEGALHHAAFHQAWQQVLDQHPSLRTAFVWKGVREPLQVVQRGLAVPMIHHDWMDLPQDEQQRKLTAFLAADRKAGFDCAHAPLIRLTVIKLAEGLHRVVWTHHHLLLDGWCVPLLLRDMLAAYDALRRGGRTALPPRRPFRDFIAWLAQQDTTEAERYWRDVVQSITAPTSLGLDRTGEIAGQASGFRSRVATLSSSSTATLQGFVQRHQLTLNTLVQGAWALLLTRYSGESDVVFGMTVSGRSAPLDGIESMVGLLINTVPIRVSVSPDVTVLSWLKALFVQNTELRLYEHTPLARIQSWSQAPNGRSLFDSLLVFENYPWDATLAEGLSELNVREIEAEDQTNYPLTMTVIPGRELTLRCSYDCTRFEDDDIRGLLGHVTCLLEELAGNPNATLADLSLLAESERHRLQNWNATARAYAHTQCVHELIEEQAERAPGAIALVYEDQRLTYEEVNARANQVAHYLLARGAGPDVLIGICLERSPDMVIGLLGILKAGSAYVPIDADYPRERIGFMVQDAAAPLLLTGRDLMSSLGVHQTRIICLDRDRPEIECERRSNPCAPVGLQNLAYTIYTSGSTGRPKGAGIPHGGLLNRLLWMQEQYSLQPDDRVLQKTPFSFDVSVWEFFWPLMAGACLVVAGPGEHRQPDRLVELIVANQVTTLHFVPPMLQAFLETPAVSLCRSIRRVICSGEALPAELQRRFFERLDAELHNLYGPTEASIDVTAWACRRNDAGPSVPIGSPIANTQIHLLDPHGHPVPVGIAGELHIGGVGLARGYHNRPDLTAEKFIPDRFSPEPGARLYRTGDLARRRADGAIEFLGRMDHQVKIRGFRIELGEIEAWLLDHPAVREAVVIAREDHPGQKRLVAYVVGLSASGRSEVDELREWLAERLPDYMVPSFILALDALPLNPNGKVDRRALPAPDLSTIKQREHVAPRTDAERILAEIWGQVLHLDAIGIHDNFFELGGDSIVTLQIVARAHQQGLKLTPRELFEYPTIAAAAAIAVPTGEAIASVQDVSVQERPDVELTEEELGQLMEEIR